MTEAFLPTRPAASVIPETGRSHGLPVAVLAELTHRCPLQCPYCSNPLELDRPKSELTTAEWQRVLAEMADLGVLQVHFSGGEPVMRPDLTDLVQSATEVGLYTNLITSAVGLSRERLFELADAGLAHVQISFQAVTEALSNRIGGYRHGHARKIEAAGWTRAAGLPLTVNAVMHRQNLHELPAMIDLAVELGAHRLEVANVQYYGWALKNRAALMPTRAQVAECDRVVAEARERLKGILTIDYVTPDYYADRPKACMGGWGRQVFNISPSGRVLPCHAAETITGLDFASVRDHGLGWIWEHSPAMNRYRGTGWMPEPCRSCAHKEEDFGGCRCQAFALAGDAAATDPACALSPRHAAIFRTAEAEAAAGATRFLYRNLAGGTPETAD